MCDKRFMPKNRSNVGKNVTINRCISIPISFSAIKKTVHRPRRPSAKLEVLTSFHDT